MNKKLEKFVFISGNFNIVHPGHIRLFRFAQEFGKKIIVGIHSDSIAGNDAFISEKLRFENLKNYSMVDDVVIIQNSLEQTIRKLKPPVIIKGKEHEEGFNSEEEILKTYGGKLIFAPGNISLSASGLIHTELSIEKRVIGANEKAYIKRHQIQKKSLAKSIARFKNVKALVIGDSIVDEYINCDALGMSQEDPTIAVAPVSKELFLGGGAIVAAHCSALGADVRFISVIGKDETGVFLSEKLKKMKLKSNLFRDISRPTSLKQRFRSQGKTLLRVNNLRHNSISPQIQKKIFNLVRSEISKTDIILLSDFNYGCLPQSLVEKIIELATISNVKVVADSQSSSQIGDIARFKNTDLITPTEKEARVSLRNNQDGLEVLGNNLLNESNSKNMLLKIGEEGVIIYSKLNEKNIITDQINALNSKPLDTAGAGDAMMVVTSLALAIDENIWKSAYLGSVAAAIQVGRLGNIPLKNKELINYV